MTMIRSTLILLALTASAIAQNATKYSPGPLHWKGPSGTWQYRLQAGDQWLPYLITDNRADGTFTLHKNVNGTWTPLDTGKDLATLKAEGIAEVEQK